jgi:hypothetical protein
MKDNEYAKSDRQIALMSIMVKNRGAQTVQFCKLNDAHE